MQALRFHRFGSPKEVLQLDKLAPPDLGTGDLRVRLTHRCVNPADLATIKGTYGKRPELPAVAGNEGVGVIEKLGPGVADFEIGQRVVPIAAGPTWQSQLVAGTERFLPVPDNVPDEAAAQIVVNPLTAWLLLESLPSSRSGDVLLLSAGAGAVARCVAQLAAKKGLKTIHVIRSDNHMDSIRALGGNVVVATENNQTSRNTLRETIGDNRAVAAFDPVVGEIGSLLLHALVEGGTHVVYGALSGKPLSVSPVTLIYRNVTVKGVWRTRWVEEMPMSQVKIALKTLLDRIDSGHLSLPVEKTFDLADWKPAITEATSHERWGKVLLTG